MKSTDEIIKRIKADLLVNSETHDIGIQLTSKECVAILARLKAAENLSDGWAMHMNSCQHIEDKKCWCGYIQAFEKWRKAAGL